MLFLPSLVVRVLVRLLGARDTDDSSKEPEILVLRHQLRVLQRKAGPAKFRAIDRVLLGVASRAIPRDRWASVSVTPATLLRWHRELVIGEIVETTGGYPYFLQFFGAYICRTVASTKVSVAAFRAVESSQLHELDLGFFDDRFEGASPTEQRVLEVMAREPGQLKLTRLGQVPARGVTGRHPHA